MWMRPSVVDLFSGAGGISHGFHRAGFSVVAGVDFDADSVKTFEFNHPGATALCADLATLQPKELADALKIRRGEVDCIAGGPPCQGFSRNRAFRHKDGSFVDDPRNHLYWHFFDFIDYLRPKFVLMENVPEILIKADGYFRDAVFARFKKSGYVIEAKVLNAAEYGVPQWRRRAIFVAGRDGCRVSLPSPTTLPGRRPGRRTPTSPEFVEPRDTRERLPLFADARPTSPTVWDAISDLYDSYADSLDGIASYGAQPSSAYQAERRRGATSVRNHYPWRLTERQVERLRLLKEGQGILHLPDALRPSEGYGSAYRRMQRDAQALTLTTWLFHPGSGMFTHPDDNRVVTIREAARLQSFQDDFVFQGKYHSQCRQVGNSVAPKLAEEIALHLQRLMGNAVEAQDDLVARAIPALRKN